MTKLPYPKRPILTLKRAAPSVPLKQTRELHEWWPRNERPHKLWVVEHPKLGVSFYNFPKIVNRTHIFAQADVYLLFGAHWDKNKGYGCVHILKEHWREFKLSSADASPASIKIVADFVASILTRKTSVLCEFSGHTGDYRPIVVKGKKGAVVLQLRLDEPSGEEYYSVVSAFTNPNVHGQAIGTL
jgi:hypothetical protein